MKQDKYGQCYFTEQEIYEMLHANPELNLRLVVLDDPTKFNEAVEATYSDFPKLKQYQERTDDVKEFDRKNQEHWFMPDSYKELDIVKWLLDQCQTQEELQRVGEELLLYGERDLIPMLQFMKYMIDTFRENNVIWGVGRGSSVASYVLYLIGVHKINSMYYDLDIREFLR